MGIKTKRLREGVQKLYNESPARGVRRDNQSYFRLPDNHGIGCKECIRKIRIGKLVGPNDTPIKVQKYVGEKGTYK